VSNSGRAREDFCRKREERWNAEASGCLLLRGQTIIMGSKSKLWSFLWNELIPSDVVLKK